MAVDPSALSQSFNPAQAGDLLKSSIAGYGTTPDPQLVTESLQMGNAPVLSSALAMGDPSLESVLLSQPVGQSQFSSKSVPPPTALFNDPYQYDENSAKAQMQVMNKAGIKTGFNSFGTMPMANLGWYNSVLQGDVPTVRKWQQFLADKGYYGSFGEDGKTFSKGEVNGYTSPDFQKAMQQWSLAYFLPQALLSRNSQESMNARQYLSALGFDVDAVANSMSHNPQQREKMIDSWLQAQGPDVNHIDALNKFADHFGSDALPDQLNKLRGDGIFNSVGNFLGHIPGVGNLLGTTPEDLDKNLTAAEKEVLNPDLQKAHDQSPFKFVGDVLGAPSKALVTAGYFFKDAATGQLGKANINPFDDTSDVSKFVADPTRQMFGDQFAKDHPWLHTIANVAVNLADDPLTFIPFVGSTKLAKTIGEGIEGFEGMSAAEKAAAVGQRMTRVERATGGLVSHRVGTMRYGYVKPTSVVRSLKNGTLQKQLAKALDPIGNAQQEVAKFFTREGVDHGLARDMLGDYSEESGAKIDKLLEMGKSEGYHAVLDFLRDKNNLYADKLLDASFLLNRNQYEKVLGIIDRLSQGKLMHIWNILHLNDSSSLVPLKQPKVAVESFRNAAMAAGVDPKVISKFVTDFWKAPADEFTRRNLADQMTKAIEEAKGPQWIQGFHKWRNGLRRGGHETQGGETFLYGEEHDPTKPRGEKSWRDTTLHFTKDIENGPTADHLNQEVTEIRQAMGTLDTNFRSKIDAVARATHPEGVVDDAGRAKALKENWDLQLEAKAHSQQMRDLQGHLDDMKATYGGVQGKSPAPMMTTQTATWAHLPYTASEIIAYNNRFLRTSETIQKRIGLDKAMGLWKSLVLSKPSTLMNVMFGDESSRVHINLLLNDPHTWTQYAKDIALRRGKGQLEDIAAAHPEMMTSFHNLAGSGVGSARHISLEPGDVGYTEALTHIIQNHYTNQEWVHGWMDAVEKAQSKGQDWEKAGKTYLRNYLKRESEQARTLRDLANVPNIKTGKNPALDDLVATKHYDISSFLHHDPEDPDRMHLWNWVKSGKVNSKQLDSLHAKYANSPNANYVLPRISGRPPTSMIPNAFPLAPALERYHEWASHKINLARSRGFIYKSNSEFERLKKFYTDGNGVLMHDPETLHRMAEQNAEQWIMRNTYQGARTVAASALRSVAPFWGATANANRFYLHTLIEHPEILHPAFRGEQGITQQQQAGGFRMNVPLLGTALSHLGLHQGDEFTFEPFRASFLTREGFGGIFPGMGPVFNVALQQMPKGIQDSISSLPGMQYAQGGSPMLPWLENLVSAYSLARGGSGFEAPFVGRQSGYYDKLVDEKFQQLEGDWIQGGRKGEAPTIQDAKNDVAANRAITGASGFALPLGVAAEDPKRARILDLEKQWDPGLKPADKEALLAQSPEIADYFRYIDPTTPNVSTDGKTSKQDILARSPWVLAYATGMSDSAIPGRMSQADTQAQYKDDVAEGSITTLKPEFYLEKVHKQEQMSQAWNEFDRLHADYQEFLQYSGVAQNSAQARQWRQVNYDPYVRALVKDYPDWGATFVKQTSTSLTGQEFASAPFSSLSTFEVIPQNPALETPATILWRAALQRREQAVSALQQVMMRGGSQIEKDMIINGLIQQMDDLSSQDPTFASQLSRYRYRSLNDLISSQAQEQVIGARVAA